MISPELLHRYPFFAPLEESDLKAISLIAEEISFEKGATIFEECDPANALYLLMEGSIDLYYRSEEEFYPTSTKVFSVGEINPGEVFGISAMIEPFKLNATATAGQKCRVIKINAPTLLHLFESNYALAYRMMVQVAKTTMERLASTRVQLAAAWA